MPLERLLVLFHQDEDKWKQRYNDLYNSPLSRHIDVPIQQVSAERAYPFDNKADYLIYFVLLQAALFSESGATLEEIASTLQKSSRTIDNRIKKYPAEHLAIDKSNRAYLYKLRLDFLQD